MDLSPQLLTALLSMLPIIELRGAIPFAIEVLHLPPLEAYIWGVMGNIVPTIFILRFLEPIARFLRKHSKYFDKFLAKLFSKTRTEHSARFKEYGAIFLVLFVAIPVPGSGAWTGALIAFLFGVSYWKALGLISLGVFGAGLIITVGWESIISLLKLIF